MWSEEGDRGGPRLSSCGHFCRHFEVRPAGWEPWLGQKTKRPHFSHSCGQGISQLDTHRGDHQSQKGTKREEPPAHSMSCQPPRHLCTGIHLGWEMPTRPPWRTLSQTKCGHKQDNQSEITQVTAPISAILSHLPIGYSSLWSPPRCSSTGSLLPMTLYVLPSLLCWIFLQGRQGPRSASSCFVPGNQEGPPE